MDFEKRAVSVTTTVQQTPGKKSVRGSALPNPGLRVNKIKIDHSNTLGQSNQQKNMIKMGDSMSVQALFLKELPDYESANTKLPMETSEWDEIIIGKFLQRVPSADQYIMKPKYTHISEETGTAIGSLYVVEQSKRKLVAIPLIIKRFSLCPLDVLLAPSKEGGFTSHPLTQEKFDKLIKNSQTFDYLDKTIDRMQELYFNPQATTVFPPYLRNVAGGVIDAIAHTITPQQKEEFFKELEENKEYLIGYEKRANLEVLQKIAEVEYDPSKEGDELDPELMHLKAKGDGDIIVTSLGGEIYNPIIDYGKVESNGVVSSFGKFPEDFLNDVIENGERIVSDVDPVTGVSLYYNKTMLGPNQSRTAYGRGEEGEPIPACSFSAYKVQDSIGIYHRGVVLPDLIDFDSKPLNMKIFYNANCYSYQSDIAGILLGNVFNRMLEFGEPLYGMTGTFVCIRGDKAIATVPILIKGRADYDDGTQCVKALDAFGKPVKLRLDYPGNAIVKIKDEYYIPYHFKFLPMSNFKELAERPEQIKQKVSAQMMDATPIKLMHTGHGQFSLRGPDMDKMASLCNWDPTNLSPGETAFLLSAKRCPMETIRESIKTASMYADGVTIHGLPETVYEHSFQTKNYDIRPVSFIKEASYIDDAETVDTLLSLNFMSAENIQKFCAMIPLLEHAGENLAQLLLASRIGMNKIPEGATATAMYKLVEVVRGLETLKLQEDEEAALSS